MGDLAASGGYWIATAADTIVADPQTLTGSIGVFAVMFNLGPLLDNKLGITTDNVHTSAYADMFSGMRALSEPERALLQHAIETTYQRFVQKVADSRGLDVKAVDEIAQGRIWTGKQALDLGYKDYVGLDACMTHLMRPGMYGAYHHITVMDKDPQASTQMVDVVGSLCENNDKFAIDRELPEIEVGDTVIIHDAGAHAHAMGFQYNGRLRSAELLFNDQGEYRLIRRRETLDDYFATVDFESVKRKA